MGMDTGERRHLNTRLDSWKLIAGHLGRSERTAMRWHKGFGLPVHRLGDQGGSVFAYPDEIDRWLEQQFRRDRSQSVSGANPANVISIDLGGHLPPTYPAVRDANGHKSDELIARAAEMFRSASHSNIGEISRLLREAINLDLGNARAFGLLSQALIIGRILGMQSSSRPYSAASDAIRTAHELDPGQPDAHCALAWIKILLERDWAGAGRALDEASTHGALGAFGMGAQALLHIASGDLGNAIAVLLETSNLNPLSAMWPGLVAWVYFLKSEFRSALSVVTAQRMSGDWGPLLDGVEALSCIKLDPPEVHIRRLLQLSSYSPHDPLLKGALGLALADSGEVGQAETILQSLKHPHATEMELNSYSLALLSIGLKDKSGAVSWLVKSQREGSLARLGFGSDPLLLTLHDSPAFQFLVDGVDSRKQEDLNSK